jgi:predicted amidohydrolase
MITLCLAQIASKLGDVAANVARVVEVLKDKAGKVDLVVLPELFITGYPTEESGFGIEKIVPLCEKADGSTFRVLSQAAKEFQVALIYGFGEEDGGKR